MTRTINAELLKQALTGKDQKEFAKATGVSVSWLQKAVTGNYNHVPRRLQMEAVCRKLKLSQNKLFPLVDAKGKGAA